MRKKRQKSNCTVTILYRMQNYEPENINMFKQKWLKDWKQKTIVINVIIMTYKNKIYKPIWGPVSHYII